MPEGKYIRQTGGRGQYGMCASPWNEWNRSWFVFENAIVGGAVPEGIHQAVEQGIKEAMEAAFSPATK
jgi:elongation factor G